MNYGTPYAETEALVACLEEDRQSEVAVLRKFSPNELNEFENVLERLLRDLRNLREMTRRTKGELR